MRSMISRPKGSKADRSTDIATSPKRLGEYDQYTSLVWYSPEPLVYCTAPLPKQWIEAKSPGLFPLRAGPIRPDSDSSSLVRVVSHARVSLVRQSSPESCPDPRKAPLRCLDGGCDL